MLEEESPDLVDYTKMITEHFWQNAFGVSTVEVAAVGTHYLGSHYQSHSVVIQNKH